MYHVYTLTLYNFEQWESTVNMLYSHKFNIAAKYDSGKYLITIPIPQRGYARFIRRNGEVLSGLGFTLNDSQA